MNLWKNRFESEIPWQLWNHNAKNERFSLSFWLVDAGAMSFFYEFSLSPLRREYGEVGGGIRRPKATIGLKAFLAPPTTFLLDLRNFMQIIFRGGASFHLLTCTVDIFPRISINNIGSGNPSARFNLHKQIRIGFEK